MSRDTAWHPERDRKNADDPFYTIKGGCLACMLPEAEAPDLLSKQEDDFDTYFVKQPKSPGEIEAACCAIEVCCTNALRYGGKNKDIISRLRNNPEYCDFNLNGQLNNISREFYGKKFTRLRKAVLFWLANKFT